MIDPLAPEELSGIAARFSEALAKLAVFGIRYALVLAQDQGAAGVVLGSSSNIAPAALVQIFDNARASVDRNLERLKPGAHLGDVTPKGPAS